MQFKSYRQLIDFLECQLLLWENNILKKMANLVLTDGHLFYQNAGQIYEVFKYEKGWVFAWVTIKGL